MKRSTTIKALGAAATTLLIAKSVQRIMTLNKKNKAKKSQHDEVETASEDSFPASDPPSWTTSAAVGSPS